MGFGLILFLDFGFIFWVSDLYFLDFGLIFLVLDLYFGCLDLYFGCPGGRTDGRADGRTDGRTGGRADGRPGRVTEKHRERIHFGNMYPEKP